VSSCDFVTLRGGLIVARAALDFAFDFEARGGRMTVDGEFLALAPKRLITDDDRASVRKWRNHLLAICTYDADAHGRPE
jgi:hypothetical protein